jgi:ATP-dependent DNA helicase RecG
MELKDSVKTLKGIGDKTAANLAKLGISNLEDLISYYPRTYVTYQEPVEIDRLICGVRQSVRVTINSRPVVLKINGKSVLTVEARDYTGTIKLMWFNCPFLRNAFSMGREYIFVGNVSKRGNRLTMLQPEYYLPEKYGELTKLWQPIYSVTSGITSKTISKAVKLCAPLINKIQDYLPEDILNQYDIMEINEALNQIHFPEDEEHLKYAIKRIAFDEFYSFISSLSRMKNEGIVWENRAKIFADDKVYEFIKNLPFRLTDAQMGAVRDVLGDMNSDHVMNRLIQGDVGSGKTIVAAIALFAAACCGYQSVIMAPTEVLATQHYKELSKLFEPYGIRVGMLIGSLTAKEKRLTQEQIKNGDIDVVVGTHALISEKAVYKNLGLVVTDEQHRFGVKQREKLSEKGDKPHTLVMSATPIPRTLAIIMYGDLDISIIDELPAGRKPIKNCVVDESYRLTAQKFIVSQVDAGHQVYIVCPMVDESENMDDVANVMDYSQELSSSLKENFNRDLSIACLHGKMKAAEKNEIMESFSKGDISVLVSTTVIEVGVNNPNATLMMVENAERFGLAQLHQLRGRVGRGDSQSYCIFMSAKKDDATRERLNVLVESNDGFYIAGEDLKMRGPGDFFGVRQSGESMFTMGDIYNHADMLKAAQEIYERYGSLVEQNLSQAEYKDMILNPVL